MKAIKITKNTIPMILLEKGSFLEWELELCVGLCYVVAEEIPIKIRELQWKDCIIAEKELHDTLEVDGDISMNKWISIKSRSKNMRSTQTHKHLTANLLKVGDQVFLGGLGGWLTAQKILEVIRSTPGRPECFPSPYLILTESFKNILWCLKQNWSSNDNSHSQKGED